MFAEKLLFSRVQKIHFRPPQAAPNTCHNFHSIMFQVIRGTYISSCLKSLNQETTETQNLCGIVLRRIFFFRWELRKGNTPRFPPAEPNRHGINPADIYLLKVNKRNTRISCEICLASLWYLYS